MKSHIVVFWTARYSNPGGGKEISVHKNFQTDSGAHRDSYLIGGGVLSRM